MADPTANIQSQIDANNQQITQLESEIAQYQKYLDALATKKNTLSSTLSGLTISVKQLATQIRVTQGKIAAANLQIDMLTNSIGDRQVQVAADQDAIGKALRSMDEEDQTPLITALIFSDSLASAWQAADQGVEFDAALATNIKDLQTVQNALSTSRDQVSAIKDQLASLSSSLSTQKQSVDANVAAERQLIAQTNNQETNYQKLIAQKQASEQSFEQALVDLANQLNLTVHPGSLPEVGSCVLAWPFSAAYMAGCAKRASYFGNQFCITQYFGNTPFATANPQIYSGHGHDGVDIGAPIGTPVHAALTGTIIGTGDTDLVHDSRGAQCWSFGKWVMIEHGNGLNTMYAHLSQIYVSKGEQVATGQVIGLSGMTGYATGPHLHFGVYATEGTEIETLRQFRGATIGCADATMPVATLDAYLNPLSYL